MFHYYRGFNTVTQRKSSRKGESRWLIISIDDGQCAIDVKVDPIGAQRDVSNYLQITEAASAVIGACVDSQQPSTGGLVKQLGAFFNPFLPVRCQEPFPRQTS